MWSSSARSRLLARDCQPGIVLGVENIQRIIVDILRDLLRADLIVSAAEYVHSIVDVRCRVKISAQRYLIGRLRAMYMPRRTVEIKRKELIRKLLSLNKKKTNSQIEISKNFLHRLRIHRRYTSDFEWHTLNDRHVRSVRADRQSEWSTIGWVLEQVKFDKKRNKRRFYLDQNKIGDYMRADDHFFRPKDRTFDCKQQPYVRSARTDLIDTEHRF